MRVIQDNDDRGQDRGVQLGRQAGLPDNRPSPARQRPRGVRIGVAGRTVVIVTTALKRQPDQTAKRRPISRARRTAQPAGSER